MLILWHAFPLQLYIMLCMLINIQLQFHHYLDLVNVYLHRIHMPLQILPVYLSHVISSFPLYNFFLPFCHISWNELVPSYLLAYLDGLLAYSFCTYHTLLDQVQMDQTHALVTTNNKCQLKFIFYLFSSQHFSIYHQ